MIREYRVTSEGLAERKARLEASQKQLAVLRAEADEERADADREAARRLALLARVKDERAYHDRMVGELSEATRRLEAFIRDLQEKQRRVAKVPPPARPAPAPGGTTGTGFAALRGRLLWPAEGKVVGEYGAQIHPRFGTKTFKNGIDIGVPEGTSIVAVYGGSRALHGVVQGLRELDHRGPRRRVLHALRARRRGQGQGGRRGQAGAVDCTVGDTGSLQGPRLYFEVRHAGRPQDPAQWLLPRG